MSLSAFGDRSHQPGPADVRAVLGPAAGIWEGVVSRVASAYPPTEEIWSYPGAKYGWSLRLVRKGRVILYMTPQKGQFLLGIVLGEKAATAARAAALPEPVLSLIEAAPRYAEGRGIRIAMKSAGDIEVAQKLAALKMAR